MAVFPSLIAALIGSLPAASSPTTMLEPVGKWVVSGEEGLCVVSRTFGEGASQLQFGVRPLGSEQKAELLLVGPRGGGGRQTGRGRVAFDGGEAIAGMYGSYVFDRPAQRITTLTIDRDIRRAMVAASAMTIEAGAATVTVRLVSIAAALDTLAQCEDLMLRRWGVDTVAYHAEQSHSTALDLGRGSDRSSIRKKQCAPMRRVARSLCWRSPRTGGSATVAS